MRAEYETAAFSKTHISGTGVRAMLGIAEQDVCSTGPLRHGSGPIVGSLIGVKDCHVASLLAMTWGCFAPCNDVGVFCGSC